MIFNIRNSCIIENNSNVAYKFSLKALLPYKHWVGFLKGGELRMKSILSELITEEVDFFSNLNIACLLLEGQRVVDCNTLALTLFNLDRNRIWEEERLDILLLNHPLEQNVLSIIDEASIQEGTVSNIWEEDEMYYIQAKKMLNDRMVIAIQNRTYEKKHDELLLQKMQLESVSHLAAGVAHELRNPLSVIQGFIQLSNMTGNLNRYYETILSEISRMNQIIEDFLSISRKKVEKKHIKPADLLNSIKALIQSECLLHGIEFDYKLHENSGYLLVNESMMKQVMLNLLRNSIEAYGQGMKGRVFRLHAGRDYDKFIMIIEDNGPGMSEHVMASLGNPFYTTKDTGTGIGIPMCKKIIKEHGGNFLIESVQKKGTKITIHLPLSK